MKKPRYHIHLTKGQIWNKIKYIKLAMKRNSRKHKHYRERSIGGSFLCNGFRTGLGALYERIFIPKYNVEPALTVKREHNNLC